ncbi:MAG: AAA family ATPase, partial [Clostridia bacterium]|nr:AAA family ATPase [Clostridia bacterium]
MNSLPGIGDPYWYEWFVGVKNVIKMLNPDNGIEYVIFQSSSYESIDDVVVGKKENIELCYQVKHVRTEKNLTFSSLIEKDEGSKKSLLTAIAEGWEKTNNINITPILYSNKTIGIRKSTRTSKITQNKYKCLSLKDFFIKVKELVDGAEKWDDIIINEKNLQEQWKEFVGQLNIKYKLEFLKKLKLELNQPSLDESEKEILDEIQKAFKCNDIISHKIFSMIVSQLRIWTTTRRKEEKITREQVLELLCKTNERKYEEFYPPMPFFETRKKFCQELYEKIVNTDKKIVFLSGVPGSGKTSAISYMNYHYKENIIGRFYAFKPISLKDKVYNFDSENTEPRTLWEILLNQIRERFTGVLEKYNVPIINELCDTKTLRAEVIRLAHKLYEITNKKSVICIDGIDHAARAESGENFLNQLYSPEEIPNGVVLLLVGQPKNLYSKYPVWIKNSNINVEEISMPKLELLDIIHLIKCSNIEWINKNNEEQIAKIILEKTEGNNLSVIYSLKEAEKCKNIEDFVNLIEIKNISNDIEEYYEMIWKHAESELGDKIKQNFWFDKVASAIVLANGPMNCNTISKAIGVDFEDLKATAEMLYPLIIEKESNVYSILHNDLRVYLTKIVKNKNSIYINTAKKMASYYLNTRKETYNRAHNMIPLFITASENRKIAEVFNTDFVIESLAEKVSVIDIKKYSIMALDEAQKIKSLKLIKIISEAISTLNQHLRYSEYYNQTLHSNYDFEKTNILELEKVELNNSNLDKYYNALDFASEVYKINPERTRNILNLWFGEYTPENFIRESLITDGVYNKDMHECIVKLWAELSYKVNEKNFQPLPKEKDDFDVDKNRIFQLCMSYNETYMKHMLENGEYDAWIEVFKCGVSVEFFQKEIIKCLEIEHSEIKSILEKIILNTKDNLIRLLTVLVVIINSQNVKDEIKQRYDEIGLENKKYYADNELMMISLWIIININFNNINCREILENKYVQLLKEIDNENDQENILNIIRMSEIIGICINNKYNTEKIVYDCDDFKEVLVYFLENKNGYHSYSSKETTDLILHLLTNLIGYIGFENEFINIIKEHLLNKRRIADFYKSKLLEYLVSVNRIDIIKDYIKLLYGENGENLFSMTDIEGIHNNFRKYLHIVDRDLEIEVDEKLKWNVARYMDYKEYALYPVLKEFNNIADIDAKTWKKEGIELYKLCCIAHELGSSLYEEEVQLDIMKQATNLGIKDLWESVSLDFTMTERLEDIYSLILHLLNIYNDEENLKNLWILSVGILSFYNKEDQIGIKNVKEIIIEKCEKNGYNKLIEFMKEKTMFYWNITKEKEENKEESSRTNDDWNDKTNEKIENLLKENFEDNYEKWKQIDSATKFLEENNRLDEKIGTCIVDIFYKIGYEYEMERSCLDNIFNRIIKYISSDDHWKIINRIVYKYREDNDEYSIRLCSENLNWLIQKILINEGNIEKMKEYFYISIGKHRSWITGANHIKTIDINIATQEHYLKEPNNLKAFVVNILLIQLGSQNIHRIEIAYKAINLMCMYDNEVIKIISQNWKHLNRTQKEQFYFMAERWIFENKEKYIPFFEKLAEENEVSNTITDKIQLLYLLEKYNKQVFELKTNKLNYKENKIDFFEELVISTQFEYICNEIDIKHYIRNAEMLLKDNCIDLKRELLLTYDANEKVDNKNIKARPGDSSLPYYKNSKKFEEILYNEFTKGRWEKYSLLRLIQTFG